MRQFLCKAVIFVKEVIVIAAKKVLRFVKGVYDHIETVAILVLATFGLANLLGELPFMITLPVWVETPFVAPVLAVLIVKMLMLVSQKRFDKHHAPQLKLAG